MSLVAIRLRMKVIASTINIAMISIERHHTNEGTMGGGEE